MMASAFFNVPPESFPPPTCHSVRGCFSPTISPRRGSSGSGQNIAAGADTAEPPRTSADIVDFEFSLEDHVAMLPADELFSDGKLLPLQLAGLRQTPPQLAPPEASDIRSIRPPAKPWVVEQGIGSDTLVLSPKAPRCTTRWRGLLGLKKQKTPKSEQSETQAGVKSPGGRSFKHLLNRCSKTPTDTSPLNLPLHRDADPESVPSSIVSRLSLSCSSASAPEHDDLPRLSLDSDRPRNPPRIRISRQTPAVSSVAPAPSRVYSPRMDPSGRIIFHGLERSSSSPGSFNGGPPLKHRGIQRSYSSNIRAPSVLNVPFCFLRGSAKSGASVFGIGQVLSQPRKEKEGSSPSPSLSSPATSVRSAGSSAACRSKAELERERTRNSTRASPFLLKKI
ncbi:hypothetical protein AXF42_Ash002319 [Apostasia shenzhenica]|uniref:Uncharacterized protein n=1 Tax=Apostasia shenzhenica TaxID=1088818 RepID=A0A2I0ANE3_9ASPA|nr:hypothetical protein AXF42_Ash002319 [Apostasia shenzhenica]